MYAMNEDATSYLVVGAGVSGMSAVRYLLSQEKMLRIIDTREIPPNADQLKKMLASNQICFGSLNQDWIDQADVIVLSPGVSLQTPEIQRAVQAGTEVLGDIEIFAREVKKHPLSSVSSLYKAQ